MISYINKIAMCFIVSTILCSVTGCEDNTYDDERLFLVKKIDHILENPNQCHLNHSCINDKPYRTLFFATPAIQGVSIVLWKLDKTSQDLIIDECKKVYMAHERRINIYIDIYDITYEEALKRKYKITPEKQVYLRMRLI